MMNPRAAGSAVIEKGKKNKNHPENEAMLFDALAGC